MLKVECEIVKKKNLFYSVIQRLVEQPGGLFQLGFYETSE